jgi:hypothetical protein
MDIVGTGKNDHFERGCRWFQLFLLISDILFSKAKKKYHMSKKSRVGRSGLIFFFFIIIIGKTGNSRSGIQFWYFIFENSGKMTNYAVFLPSLLSISTKS